MRARNKLLPWWQHLLICIISWECLPLCTKGIQVNFTVSNQTVHLASSSPLLDTNIGNGIAQNPSQKSYNSQEKQNQTQQAEVNYSNGVRTDDIVDFFSFSLFEYKAKIRCLSSRVGDDTLVDTSEACEEMCTASVACKAWSWHWKKRRCSIFRNCKRSRYNRFTHSGIKTTSIPNEYNLYSALKCEDSSIGTAVTDSATDCGEVCSATQGCKAWTFRGLDNRCFWKEKCQKREQADAGYVSGINAYDDTEGDGAGELTCSSSLKPCEDEDLEAGESCPVWSFSEGESTDPEPGSFISPYEDILNGTKTFVTTYPDRKDYRSCRFQAPQDPLHPKWTKACIRNMKRVGFRREVKARPNKECPAGWFLCKGMCYTLVQRYSRGPEQEPDDGAEKPSYYGPDYMGVEQRCGACGGARVAFVGDDPDMQRVAAEAARQTINEDKATWVRRYRFLSQSSAVSEAGDNPYQPWHRYVTMIHEDPVNMTYQRYYTGQKDGISEPQYDIRYRNQEGSILCVNTLDRIAAAARTVNGMLTMENGCEGKDRHDMWDNDKHRWFPEHNWPYPGL